MKTIPSKLIVIYSVFLTFGAIGIVYGLTNKQEVDGIVYSLKGKQKMLVQKVSANEFIISQGIGSKESIEQVINLFGKSLKDSNSFDMNVKPPSIQDKKIQKQLSQKEIVHFVILLKLLSESETM